MLLLIWPMRNGFRFWLRIWLKIFKWIREQPLLRNLCDLRTVNFLEVKSWWASTGHIFHVHGPRFSKVAQSFLIFETPAFVDAEVSNFDWENEGLVSPVRNQGIFYNLRLLQRGRKSFFLCTKNLHENQRLLEKLIF